MSNQMSKAHRYSSMIDFAGLIAFFLVWKLAPAAYQVAASSATLLVFTFLQIAFYKYHKLKIPNHVLFITGLVLIFTTPAMIFNDFKFIRLKLLVIKALFFIIPVGFLLFKKNFFHMMFKDMNGMNMIKEEQYTVINWWFIATSAVSLVVTIYAYFFLSNDAFVTLKTFWLPAIGMIYIFPLLYYTFKAQQEAEALKNSGSSSSTGKPDAKASLKGAFEQYKENKDK